MGDFSGEVDRNDDLGGGIVGQADPPNIGQEWTRCVVEFDVD
jgi:hypothetical protein